MPATDPSALCTQYLFSSSQPTSEGKFFYFPHVIDNITRFREVKSISKVTEQKNGGSGVQTQAVKFQRRVPSPQLKGSPELKHQWDQKVKNQMLVCLASQTGGSLLLQQDPADAGGYKWLARRPPYVVIHQNSLI